MKVKVHGVKVIDYTKDGKQISGFELQITKKSSECIGDEVDKIYFSDKSSFFYDIKKYLETDLDSLLGSTCIVDYDVSRRGNSTFSSVVGFEVLPKDNENDN